MTHIKRHTLARELEVTGAFADRFVLLKKGRPSGHHRFDAVCRRHGSEHCLIPRFRGQPHGLWGVSAANSARPLKRLNCKSPIEASDNLSGLYTAAGILTRHARRFASRRAYEPRPGWAGVAVVFGCARRGDGGCGVRFELQVEMQAVAADHTARRVNQAQLADAAAFGVKRFQRHQRPVRRRRFRPRANSATFTARFSAMIAHKLCPVAPGGDDMPIFSTPARGEATPMP